MTTPTTGTAPLIERLMTVFNEYAEEPLPDRPHLRRSITAAIGPDVLVIEREQARETIRNVVEVLENDAENYWPGASEIADASVAALTGEERP